MTLHHRRIHENVKIHECSTCGKRYPLPSELRKHIRRVHETPKKAVNQNEGLREVKSEIEALASRSGDVPVKIRR
ncbi:zinc finger, C2H2 type [Ostertagia ostertagi]